jgi:APA family basic amino acid/polyamine antiporter
VAYLVCSLALLVLLRRGGLGEARRGTPGLAVAGALGALYSLWAIAGAGKEATAWGAALLVAGLPVYALTRRASGGRS